MLEMRIKLDNDWEPPILKTVAINAEGITKLRTREVDPYTAAEALTKGIKAKM